MVKNVAKVISPFVPEVEKKVGAAIINPDFCAVIEYRKQLALNYYLNAN